MPSEAELAAIRVAATEQMRCMVDLELLTGLRKGDLLKLRLSDITDAGIRIEVQKTGAALTFQWSAELRACIDAARRLRRRVGSLYLYANRKGQRYTDSGWDCLWRRTLARARVVGLTFHDLRRYVITEAKRQGGLDYAQAIGAHRSRQATERYVMESEVVVRPLR